MKNKKLKTMLISIVLAIALLLNVAATTEGQAYTEIPVLHIGEAEATILSTATLDDDFCGAASSFCATTSKLHHII